MSSIRASTDHPVLEVERLRVDFDTRWGLLRAIDDISFEIGRGEVLGMVGESGAGKSLTGAALIGLMPSAARVSGGIIKLEGEEIQDLKPPAMRKIRGRRIATIFQDPLTSLNPLFTIGWQLSETIAAALDLSRGEAEDRAKKWLARVGLPDIERRFKSYPHEFSGGMRQRVVVALALCTEPDLVIADEPTTALDVSVQAQILQLLRELVHEEQTALLLITHDIGVIAEMTDRLAVLYLGRIVEMGATADVLKQPAHPYTQGLMQSVPRLGAPAERLQQLDGAMPRLSANPWQACAFQSRCAVSVERCSVSAPSLVETGTSVAACHRAGELAAFQSRETRERKIKGAQPSFAGDALPLLAVEDLACHFDLTSSLIDRIFERRDTAVVRAVDGVSFSVQRGQTFALVGESGCGKSTIAKAVTGLLPPTGGRISIGAVPVSPPSNSTEQCAALRSVQMVFQDPYSSLDPRWSVRKIIAEPMHALGRARRRNDIEQQVNALLRQVGLSEDDGRRYPHAFSGGQRQRISIARALAGDPKLLVCDEPTSALDVSVQAQILNLMKDLQREHHLTMLFISHDLAVVNFIADVVGVMYLGRMCEIAAPQTLFTRPLHPYTRMLRDAVPDLETLGVRRRVPQGDVPSALSPPPGCRFHTRCPFADDRCRSEKPAMRSYPGAWAACHALQEGRIEVAPSEAATPVLSPFPDSGPRVAPQSPPFDQTRQVLLRH